MAIEAIDRETDEFYALPERKFPTVPVALGAIAIGGAAGAVAWTMAGKKVALPIADAPAVAAAPEPAPEGPPLPAADEQGSLHGSSHAPIARDLPTPEAPLTIYGSSMSAATRTERDECKQDLRRQDTDAPYSESFREIFDVDGLPPSGFDGRSVRSAAFTFATISEDDIEPLPIAHPKQVRDVKAFFTEILKVDGPVSRAKLEGLHPMNFLVAAPPELVRQIFAPATTPKEKAARDARVPNILKSIEDGFTQKGVELIAYYPAFAKHFNKHESKIFTLVRMKQWEELVLYLFDIKSAK